MFVDPDAYPSGQFPTTSTYVSGVAASQYDMDAVDPEYVCTVINPEDNMARQQQAVVTDTAISRDKYIQNITTNSSGNVGVFIFPN